MRTSTLLAGLLSVAAIVVVFAIVHPSAPPVREASHPRSSFEATVARVVDGDTVDLADGRALRYVGVDCPEHGEAFADEATARNRALVAGKRVRVETEAEATDRYGRVLGTVWVEGSPESVNETLVDEGLALAFFVPPNESHKEALLAAQGRARAARHGIWSKEVEKREAYYVGSSERFHRPSCPHVSEISRPVRFATREDALDSGRSPCRTCKP